MAKKPSLANALKKTAPANDTPTPVTVDHSPVSRPKSRQGKKTVTSWIEPAAKKQLAMLSIEEERPEAELLIEAINLLFAKYDRPPIA